jgi:hypothetical protein
MVIQQMDANLISIRARQTAELAETIVSKRANVLFSHIAVLASAERLPAILPALCVRAQRPDLTALT